MTNDEFKQGQFSDAVDMLAKAEDFLLVTLRDGQADTIASDVPLTPFMIDMAKRYYADQVDWMDREHGHWNEEDNDED